MGVWGIKHLNTETQGHRGIFKEREKRGNMEGTEDLFEH